MKSFIQPWMPLAFLLGVSPGWAQSAATAPSPSDGPPPGSAPAIATPTPSLPSVPVVSAAATPVQPPVSGDPTPPSTPPVKPAAAPASTLVTDWGNLLQRNATKQAGDNPPVPVKPPAPTVAAQSSLLLPDTSRPLNRPDSAELTTSTSVSAPASSVPASAATAPVVAPPLASSAPLPSVPALPATATAAPEPSPSALEHASLMRIGATKLAAGDADSARIAFREVAESSEDPDELAHALIGLARAYRLGGDLVKSAATYEHLIKDNPDHPLLPTAWLELGRTLRDLGSPKLAITSFYNVLQTAIKFPEAGGDSYRRLALTAQFEIAETHLDTGNYAEAVRFFNRLNLLDLSESDRAHARFKSAQALTLSGDKAAAILALQAFIKLDPNDVNSPEARFLLATQLTALNRREESLQVTLDLLHHEHDLAGADAAQWRAWQERTGNQLANQFYTQGDFTSALSLYKALAALDPAPAWRLPVLYQIGLCQERLMQTDAALDEYQQITKLADTPSGEFADLARMAAWRISQLTWLTHTQADLSVLLTPQHMTASTPVHP